MPEKEITIPSDFLEWQVNGNRIAAVRLREEAVYCIRLDPDRVTLAIKTAAGDLARVELSSEAARRLAELLTSAAAAAEGRPPATPEA